MILNAHSEMFFKFYVFNVYFCWKYILLFLCNISQENEGSGGESGSDPPSDEAEDLDDEEEEEYEDLRPAKRPRHGGFIIEEAG